VQLLNSGKIRLDCLHLMEEPTPVAASSWGRIKAIYQAR